MEKNIEQKDIDIFICCHKQYDFLLENPVYKVITGQNVELNTNLEIYRDTGTKLSEMNHLYGEGSRIYWIWKKYNLKKYIGFCHYRTYFDFLDNIPNIDEIFQEHDIIVTTPYETGNNYYQYCYCHSINDLKQCLDIIKLVFPDYEQTVKDFVVSDKLFIKNMFIMKKEDFEKYCNFVFTVLDIFNWHNNIIDLKSGENYVASRINLYATKNVDYQTRLHGFLLERLTTIFIMHNFKNIKFFQRTELNK